MNLHSLYQIFVVFLLSAFKFGFGGVPIAVLVDKFPFFKAVTITTAGAVAGAIIFANLSEWLLDKWDKFRSKYFPYRPRKNVPENKFTKKIREKWGLYGLAFFTPFILSIPVGTLLSVHFYHDKQKVISYMIVSIVCWDFFFYYFYNYLYPMLIHHL
ncbi:MAG TPA: hypothetical protein VK808_03355 [Bacteroidia bacterium]|jgi:hypothetical protein|nr:hypothetical protein [Bacteroidia bacterium]